MHHAICMPYQQIIPSEDSLYDSVSSSLGLGEKKLNLGKRSCRGKGENQGRGVCLGKLSGMREKFAFMRSKTRDSSCDFSS